MKSGGKAVLTLSLLFMVAAHILGVRLDQIEPSVGGLLAGGRFLPRTVKAVYRVQQAIVVFWLPPAGRFRRGGSSPCGGAGGSGGGAGGALCCSTGGAGCSLGASGTDDGLDLGFSSPCRQ